MGRNDRKANQSEENASTVDGAEKTESKGRKTLDVGIVTVGISTREIVKKRKSKLDTDPVAVAVRDAAPGVNYEIAFEEGKSRAIVSTLRRAGQHYNRGVNIPLVNEEDKVIVFNVGDRKTRKPKETAPVSTEDAPEQWAGPTHEAPAE